MNFIQFATISGIAFKPSSDTYTPTRKDWWLCTAQLIPLDMFKLLECFDGDFDIARQFDAIDIYIDTAQIN